MTTTIAVAPARKMDDYRDAMNAAGITGYELDYQTDLGPGTKLFWEHRNVFGAGERFRAELGVSEPQQSATLSLNKPDFFRSDQTLLTEAILAATGAPQEDPRAGLCFPSLFTICPVLRTAGWPVSVTALYGLRHPRDLGLRVLPGRRVPSSSRSSSTGGRPARSIFLRTWPSSLAMKTPPTPVKPVWS